MPKRRTTYQNKRGIRFTKRQYASLENAIRNYNKRLQAAIKRTPKEFRKALPKRVKISILRDQSSSTAELKRIIANLNRFRGEGFGIVSVEGLPTTQAQLEIWREDIARENRRRRSIRKQIAAEEEAQGRFRTRGRQPLSDLDEEQVIGELLRQRYEEPEEYGTIGDARMNMDDFMRGKVIDERTAAWQQRYLDQLEEIEVQGVVLGVPNVSEIIQDIRNIVMNLSPIQYYYAEETIPVLHISITSDIMLFLNGLEEIRQAWENFFSRFG